MNVSLRVPLVIVASIFLSVSVFAFSAFGQQPASKPAEGQGQQGTQAQQGQQGQQGQTGQAPAAPAFSAEESQAYKDLMSEAQAGLDPDKVISLAEDYAKKYPSSLALTAVYSAEASAYSAKGDALHTVEASEKSLKLNGDNLASLLLLTTYLPQPQALQGSDADKLKKLEEGDEAAKHALDLIDQGKIPRAPNETDDAYTKRKNSIASGPHAAMGMIHLQRATMGLSGVDQNELTQAAQEFKQSVEMTDRPAPEHYYRLGEVYKMESKLDDAIAAFSKCSELAQGTGLQPYADKQVADLKKLQASKAAGAH